MEGGGGCYYHHQPPSTTTPHLPSATCHPSPATQTPHPPPTTHHHHTPFVSLMSRKFATIFLHNNATIFEKYPVATIFRLCDIVVLSQKFSRVPTSAKNGCREFDVAKIKLSHCCKTGCRSSWRLKFVVLSLVTKALLCCPLVAVAKRKYWRAQLCTYKQNPTNL